MMASTNYLSYLVVLSTLNIGYLKLQLLARSSQGPMQLLLAEGR